MPLFPLDLRRLYRSDENVGIGESLRLIRFLQYSANYRALHWLPAGYIVVWPESDRPVKIRFSMQNADLYRFWFGQ